MGRRGEGAFILLIRYLLESPWQVSQLCLHFSLMADFQFKNKISNDLSVTKLQISFVEIFMALKLIICLCLDVGIDLRTIFWCIHVVYWVLRWGGMFGIFYLYTSWRYVLSVWSWAKMNNFRSADITVGVLIIPSGEYN